MGWLLELLLDGIREICSQFIVDMMELVTEMFTELLSCNLSLFEELFSVVSALYKNVIVPMGIAILLLILVWQLFKSMFGKSVNSEEPIELIIRSAIALFFVVAAKPIVNYILRFAGTPYQWVVGTEIEVKSFSGFVSALEGVTETLGIGKLSISLLMLIMQFVVAWNYFKMLFIIAERYVLLGVFSYTAPLAFSTGGSKSTNNILASWAKMFGGQVVLIILNAWCMKMFLSGYGNMMASSYGFTKFFVATLCLVGFCKITFKLDSYMASLGVNLGRPSAGMGAMGLLMTASRIISQIGRGSAGDGGSSSSTTAETSGVSAGSGMTEGFTGPIPMTAGETYASSMDMADESTKGSFNESADMSSDIGEHGDFSYSGEETAGSSVLDELGVVTAVDSKTEGTDTMIQTESGTGIGSREGGADTGTAYGNTGGDSHGVTNGDGIHIDGFGEEAPMDMNFSGIPEYGDGSDITDGSGIAEGSSIAGGSDIADGSGIADGMNIVDGTGISDRASRADGVGMADGLAAGEKLVTGERQTMELGNGLAERGASGDITAMEPGPGNENGGIISEIADYPVDREIPESTDECDMELDGNMIDSMGSGSETEGVSYGSAGDAYGNSSLASRGSRTSGRGTGFRPDGTAGVRSGSAPFTAPEGIIAEVGTDFGAGSIEPYGSETAAGMERKQPGDSTVAGNGGMEMSSDMGMYGGTEGIFGEPGRGFEADRIEPFEASSGMDRNTTGAGMGTEKSDADLLDSAGVSQDMAGFNGEPGTDFETGDMEPYGEATAEMNRKLSGDGMDLDRNSTDFPTDSAELRGTGINAGTGMEAAEGDMDQENTESTPYMADQMIQDFDSSQDEMSQSADPVDEMAGQMNHLDTGGSVPAGNRRGHGRKKTTREFREVPKTREELRRRQQEKKNQKPVDGLD